MRQLTLASAVLLLSLLSISEAYAQISASETEGCAPLASVQFSNAYTNPTGITWNFGDGASSNLLNPTKSYANAGIYIVTFTATVNGSTVNDELIITVYENPQAQFSVNPAGVCLGNQLSFNDESVGGSGTSITDWQWDYGNGTAGNFGANPTYTYPNPGSYQVTLVVIDENGCTESSTVSGAAIVSTPPNVNVLTTPSPASACEAPLTVSFTNNSTSNSPTGGGLTFTWDLGNGTTSTDVTPDPVTYTDNGFYTVTITATDNIECTATQTISITVQEPEAEISVVGGESGTVCSNVNFEIVGTTGGIFNYGDGSSGISTNHQYFEEGEYTVIYNANVSGCSAQDTTTINVEIPTATLVSDPGFSCSKPADFNYELESTYDIVDYAWNFPVDPSTSTDPNPTVTLDYEGPNEYGINGLFTFTSTVVFTTANGCEGSAFKIDSIALPNALFYLDTDQGCAPLDVLFTNESTYLFLENLAAAEWHYGDGTIETTGPEDDAGHTYNTPGEYDAFLIITTTEGCIDTSFFHTIEVGEELTPSFTVSPDDICRDDSVTLTNTSVDIDLIDGYSYSADLNTLSSCTEEESPTFAFNDFAGTAIITQFVDYNGCISSSEVTVEVSGPVGYLTYGCNCDTPFDYTFTAEVFDANSWTWEFGDGTVVENSTELMASHTYSETGDYEAILTTFNEGTSCGSHADTVLVKVRDLSAAIGIDTLICAGVQISASAIELQDVAGSNGGCYRNYLWDFGDNTRPVKTLGPEVNHVFQNGGDFTVSLTVKDDNECVFTTTRELSAFSVQANYETDTLYGCLPLEVNFSDLSIGDTTVVSWEWDFDFSGEGSVEQNPTFTYDGVIFNASNEPIPYLVTLLVTDALGCVDEISTLIIEPLAPNPEFAATTSAELCAGDDVTFQPTGSNVNFHTYEWDYGNGATSEGSTGNSIYNESGTYTVSLIVTDSIGCFREEIQEIVFVQDFPIPVIGTNFDEDESLCYPFVGSFSNESIIEAPGSIFWVVELVGTVANQESVGTTYLEPGLYDVSLTVETTFGCESDTTITVEVEGPLAEIGLDPNAICPGGSIELTLSDTADLAFWQFDFGDGSAESNEWITQHSYEPSFIPETGSTVLTLIMFSADSACSSARTVDLIIEEVIADFDRNNEFSILDSIHCFGTVDQFTSISSANATDYFWTISNGQQFSSQNVSTTLPPGDFEVELIVNSALGCADTLTKNMTIFPLPEPTVNEGEICQGEVIELTVTGGISYLWSPITGLDDASAQTVQAAPQSSINYTITVTDGNDCMASAQSFVLVYEPPPSISVDTTLRIGDSDIAGLYLGEGYTYLWTPDIELECDTCATTLFRPFESREYTLSISDTLGCFTVDSYFFFEILEVASVVVPDAFTPNGDGVNDIIYVEGWGIEELISFQIYNRWGELVFETADENEGWDGTYKGEIQNPDSYAYVVVAKNFIFGNPETFKGFLDLVK